jgi:hypothetical protein
MALQVKQGFPGDITQLLQLGGVKSASPGFETLYIIGFGSGVNRSPLVPESEVGF